MRLPLIAFIAALFALPSASAQSRRPPGPGFVQPPPALLVNPDGKRSIPLKVTKVDARVRIIGHLAETTTTITFFNDNDRVMEGELIFPLPEGVTISGYALDIGGQMIDGVVVGKARARAIFEAEVRKGVDPGLVEWTRGNNFRTRVFPIPAKGARTIRMSYVQEVDNRAGKAVYVLPLAYKDVVEDFSLRIEVPAQTNKPVVAQGKLPELEFGTWQKGFMAELNEKKVRLDQDLHIELPHLSKTPVRTEQAVDGSTYFALRHTVPAPATVTRMTPGTVGVFWDASKSRINSPLKQERETLMAALADLGELTVKLVVFRNAAEAPASFQLPGDAAKLSKALEDIPYDGGTQLGALPALKTDMNVLVSDGISNFGLSDPATLKAPTWVLNGSTTASHTMLRHIAWRTGGDYLNLSRIAQAEAVKSVGRPAFTLMSVTATGADIEQLFPSGRVPVHEILDLAGKLTAPKGTITLKFGVGSRVTHEKTFEIVGDDSPRGETLRRYWAQKQVDELASFPERNADAIAEVGKMHGIVTRGTSLLVLETLAQYLEHDVRPPANQGDFLAQWEKAQASAAVAKRQEREAKIDAVVRMWEAKVAWWSKEYKYPKDYRFGGSPKKKMAERSAARPSPTSAAEPAPESGAEMEDSVGGAPQAKSEKADKDGKAGREGASIKMAKWNPQTPYTKAIRAAKPGQHYAEYLKQRQEFGDAPAFYLDCADVLFELKQPALGLRILSNLAELELESAQLVRVLAGRLLQLGELDLAIMLYETVLPMRPDEPQTYRDLALAHSRRATTQKTRADYAAALANFNKVVMGTWERFSEIEVIALTELNAIIPAARRAGLKELPIDKRLVKHLDMDVRIVMTWDADSTDMDLHVVEPSTEEAYYGHNLTKIGGMVSRDFTQGYGPEVYSIRRAMPGKYQVKTKFYGSSAAKLIGAVTLQVDVYTNFGRTNEKRQSMTLRLTERKENFVVGEIEFKP